MRHMVKKTSVLEIRLEVLCCFRIFFTPLSPSFVYIYTHTHKCMTKYISSHYFSSLVYITTLPLMITKTLNKDGPFILLLSSLNIHYIITLHSIIYFNTWFVTLVLINQSIRLKKICYYYICVWSIYPSVK